jgi:serine/threonine-protein kinase
MRPGDLVGGKYLLQRRIGEGGMGLVWAARNELTHGLVALKILADPRPDDRARLLREARAIGSLRHPNIVEIYDVGETEDGDPFLVMQLLQGETLRARLARAGRLPQARAAEIACYVARALRAAHQKGIVHRDLKPANVFLHREPEAPGEVVKILDFGVSKHLGSGELTATNTGELVGSPAYMSPEQARGAKAIDPRCDLWALGVLLFEMIAGRRPFVTHNAFTAIAEILTAPIPRLADLVPGLEPSLAWAVDRCLTRDLAQRMGSAEELLAALAPIAGDATRSLAGTRQPALMPPVVRAPARLVATERMIGPPQSPASPAALAAKRAAETRVPERRRTSPVLLGVLAALGAIALAAAAFFAGRAGRPGAGGPPRDPTASAAPVTAIPWVTPTAGPRGQMAIDAPAETRIFVDGRLAGVAPIDPLTVAEGEHLLVFQHAALGSRAASVVVPAGSRTEYKVAFAADAGP